MTDEFIRFRDQAVDQLDIAASVLMSEHMSPSEKCTELHHLLKRLADTQRGLDEAADASFQASVHHLNVVADCLVPDGNEAA